MKQDEETQRLRQAANGALAYLEGRRDSFSTRDLSCVISVLRKALGEHVNEDHGQWRLGLEEAVANWRTAYGS